MTTQLAVDFATLGEQTSRQVICLAYLRIAASSAGQQDLCS